MRTIDPDAIYTFTRAQSVSGVSQHRLSVALQSGALPSTRTSGGTYQITGSDLMAFRDRVRAEIVAPPSRVQPGVRLEAVEMLQWLTDDEVRAVLAEIRRIIRDRVP